jgi:hypothetical protein
VPVPRSIRPVRLGAWVILVVLCGSGLIPFASAAPTTPSASFAPAPATGCTGPSIPATYTGAVTVEGGPVNASAAAGVTLSYNYSVDLQTVNRSTGNTVGTTCAPENGSTLSGPNGSFAVDLVLPALHCTPVTCTSSSGPFGPLETRPSSKVPAGYAVQTTTNGSVLSVAWVAELGRLHLDPSGSTQVLSAGAPGAFAVRALEASGAPSPLSPTIAWNLSGAGWSFVGTSAGANVTIAAPLMSGTGQLAVVASVTVGTDRFVAGPYVVNLVAVPTAFTGADANRTDLDAGGTVAFSLTGRGAPGYAYSAEVSPGLGLAPVDWSCASSAVSGSTVGLACNGTVAYPTAGVADPSAQITNTYSVAAGSLPPLTVAPRPALSLSPGAPAGYVGTPIGIRVTAVAGSGTTPYARACLAPGFGSDLCSSSPGPNWTFAPAYPDAGTYAGVAWTIDRDGTNVSVSFPVLVLSPLSLSPLEATAPILADAPTELSAQVYGGALPLRYWWNASGTPISVGTLSIDGEFDATWVPNAPGSVVLSLSVVDGLGTLVSTTELATVGAPVAASLAEVTVPGAAPTTAGAPAAIAWQAEDLQGRDVPGFSTPGSLSVSPSGGVLPGSAWVNASGVGPLTESGAGTFTIPVAAWNLGHLALTVAMARAGSFEARLEGTGLVGETPAVDITVVANVDDLHLYAPTVVLAGTRVNRTFYRIADDFDNPVPGAAVDIFYTSGGTSNETNAPVQAAGPGATGVWVNYTSRTEAGGTLLVTETDAAQTVLLGPIAIPPAATGAPALGGPILTLAALAPVGAVGVGLTAWAHRRRRNATDADDVPDETELRAMVEGRDRVIAIVRDARAIDLASLEARWGAAPRPPELADWVASLVADGTLGARTGPDGVARFCLIASPDGPPIVLLDLDALDRATATRDALTGPDPPEDEFRD